jgi:hypothetical protein
VKFLKFKTILMSSIAAIAFAAAACGGGGGNGPNPPAISVSLSPAPPTSITAGATASLTAVVSNDSSNGGVTWSVTCGSSSCGTFTPATTASGSATTYTAPANVPTGGAVNIVASSVTDGTATAAASITIAAPAGVSVSFAATPPAALTINNTFPLTAVVAGDSKNAGVTWSVTCGTSACGTFSPTATASNAATTYTAPAAIPTGNTVKVVATSVSDMTKTASATITIVGPALADGTYIYNGSGEDSNGVLYYAGAFTVLNGAVTGGEHDYLDQGNAGTDTITAAGSSVTTQPEGSVEIILNTGDPNFGDSGVFTLRGAKVSGARMQLTEFDDFATATGTLELQTGKAAPTGGYAFQLSGLDGDTSSNNGPNPLGIGGVLVVNGTTISTTNSIFDYNDGGTVGQSQTFASGTVTAPDSFGRIQISLTPSGSGGAPQFGMIGYIIGTNRIQIIETNGDGINGTMGGTAFGQGANTGNFTTGNVTGSVYVFTAVGDDGGGMTIAGGLSLNTGGAVQGNVTFSDLNTNGSQNVTGSWTVDATGRVTVSNITPTPTGTPLAFQFYLDGNGNGTELGIDTSQVSAGTAYAQTSGNINAGNYAIGAFGFFVDGTVTNQLDPWSAAGPLTITGTSLNGFTDYNANGTLTNNATLTGTIDATTGQVAINGLDVNNTNPDSYGFYPVDGGRTLLIEFDGNQLGIAFLETVTP